MADSASATSSKVLFEITEDLLDTGLRGFPVGTCKTSAVDPETGVSYVGYPIADLARRCKIPDEVFRILHALPKKGHPMEWFLTAILALGMTGKTGDYKEDGLNLIARISTVVAAIYRIREGWGDPIPPRHDLPFHQNFVHMLGIKNANPILPELLRLFYVLHMDHDGGNLSTFTGKAVASGKADVYASMSAAMAALYGPRHGRANQECLEFTKSIGTSDPKAVEQKVRGILKAGGVVYGFGHAVLRREDPRAAIQYAFGEKHFGNSELVKTALALRKVVTPILKENPKISNPYPNVDAISGSLLTAAGLTDPEYYTVLFGWSRVAGITSQIIDERFFPGKKDGLPIYRPNYIAVQQPPRRLQKA
jgi:citrate synthase